jgi:hypothetical protein
MLYLEDINSGTEKKIRQKTFYVQNSKHNPKYNKIKHVHKVIVIAIKINIIFQNITIINYQRFIKETIVCCHRSGVINGRWHAEYGGRQKSWSFKHATVAYHAAMADIHPFTNCLKRFSKNQPWQCQGRHLTKVIDHFGFRKRDNLLAHMFQGKEQKAVFRS